MNCIHKSISFKFLVVFLFLVGSFAPQVSAQLPKETETQKTQRLQW